MFCGGGRGGGRGRGRGGGRALMDNVDAQQPAYTSIKRLACHWVIERVEQFLTL